MQGNLGILKSACEKGSTVRRIVMTSSTLATAPPDILTSNTSAHEVLRGPDTRVSVPPPPYASQLEAYCVSKAAALNASEEFIRTHEHKLRSHIHHSFWIFEKDELAKNTEDSRTGSRGALMNILLTGRQREPSVGNAVLCSDVVRGHVRALDPDIAGNQSFMFNVEANWEDTLPIVQRSFPKAFKSGLFVQSDPQQTVPIKWDLSKVYFPPAI